MMNALQIAPYWKKYFHHPAKAQLGLINAIFPVGKICGLAMVTPIGERFGRRTALLVAFIICIIGSAIQAASVIVGMLVFSRWFLGIHKPECFYLTRLMRIGVGTALMAQPSPIIITELAYPTHRGKVTALFNTFYVRNHLRLQYLLSYTDNFQFFGAIFVAWLTYMLENVLLGYSLGA